MSRRNLLLLGLAAAAGTLGAAPASAACRFAVTSFVKAQGAAADDLTPVARFGDLKLTPRAVGYGAAGERRDEVTVADGKLYLTRPDGDAVSTRHAADADEGPLFLHLAQVRAWGPAQPLGAAGSLDGLAERLDAVVAEAGCASGATLAFRIDGRAETVTWSLDTKPEPRQVTSNGEPVVIVGIYSTEVSAYAMPVGRRRFHAHVVVPGPGGAGHVRAVRLADGALLRLQIE